MKVLFWPDWKQTNEAAVSLEDFLSKLKLRKKHPDLFALAKNTIKKAGEPGGLETLQDSEYAAKLRNESELWEFRIPPKKRKGGVVRIYFCIIKDTSERIVCLDAEMKKVVESSSQKLASARKRHREMTA
jgi:hypothetical protein